MHLEGEKYLYAQENEITVYSYIKKRYVYSIFDVLHVDIIMKYFGPELLVKLTRSFLSSN